MSGKDPDCSYQDVSPAVLSTACRLYHTTSGPGPPLAARYTPSFWITLFLVGCCHVRSGSGLSEHQSSHLSIRSVELDTPVEAVTILPDTFSCSNVTFSSPEISLNEAEVRSVEYNINCTYQPPELASVIDHVLRVRQTHAAFVGLHAIVSVLNADIAVIEGRSEFNLTRKDNPEIDELTSASYWTQSYAQTTTEPNADDKLSYFIGNFSVRGLQFGRTVLVVNVTPLVSDNRTMASFSAENALVVKREDSVINIVFLAVLGIMIVIYNFGFGCKVDSTLILEIVKRPVAPAIGFCCQFLVMSPLSYGIAVLLNLPPETGLGLLAIGSAPGGGGSNVFSYLLNGDLELSITMTFFSTVASLGMTPLWIWALGRFFTGGDKQIKIPVVNVFSSLAIVTIPVIIGVVVNRYKPRVGKKIAWCLKPATAIIGIVFISMGVYVYYPGLKRVTWQTIVACIVVSFTGYALGAGMGKLCRQKRERWITIALETGFQNLALSLMIIGTSLDPPESDLAGVVPVCYTFLSSAMPATVFIGMCIRRMCHGEKPWKSSQSQDITGDDSDGNESGKKYAVNPDMVLEEANVPVATIMPVPISDKAAQAANHEPSSCDENEATKQNGAVLYKSTSGANSSAADIERL